MFLTAVQEHTGNKKVAMLTNWQFEIHFLQYIHGEEKLSC